MREDGLPLSSRVADAATTVVNSAASAAHHAAGAAQHTALFLYRTIAPSRFPLNIEPIGSLWEGGTHTAPFYRNEKTALLVEIFDSKDKEAEEAAMTAIDKHKKSLTEAAFGGFYLSKSNPALKGVGLDILVLLNKYHPKYKDDIVKHYFLNKVARDNLLLTLNAVLLKKSNDTEFKKNIQTRLSDQSDILYEIVHALHPIDYASLIPKGHPPSLAHAFTNAINHINSHPSVSTLSLCL